MNKRQRQVHERCARLFPHAVIQAATTGNPYAIAPFCVITAAITSLSLRTLYDGQGKV